MDFDEDLTEGKLQYISDDAITAFIEEVKGQSVLFGDEVNSDVDTVYSPLNGTDLVPVTCTLSETGFTSITVL